MEQDPTRICELLVGLGDVDVVGVDDEATEPLVVHIQTRSRPVCGGCGGLVWSKGTSAVRLVDLPANPCVSELRSAAPAGVAPKPVPLLVVVAFQLSVSPPVLAR